MANFWIYDKVKSLVRRYKTRSPEELVDAMNITILPLIGTTHLLGMYGVIERNRYIFLSEDVGHQKKTILAHELGHDQLHRSLCKNGAPFQENKVFNPTNRYELEANIFACHLLISDADVRRVLRSGQSDLEMAAELDVDVNLLNLKISEMAKMGKLDATLFHVERPQSDFLKTYTPDPEDWSGC